MPKKKTRPRGLPRGTVDAPTSPPSRQPQSRSLEVMVQLPRLLTVEEVADFLRTTRKAVYCLIHRGELPGVIRLSRRVLVDGSALVEWFDDKRSISLTRGNQR